MIFVIKEWVIMMVFNSFQFLAFFPLVCVIYFAIPYRFRHIWLLAASYYFYMCWNSSYALLMLLSTVITYASGIFLGRFRKISDKRRSKSYAKFCVAASLISNLSILVFFKYFDFIIHNINRVIFLLSPNANAITNNFDVLLPVGISFYTFQALSYTIDVYRNEIPPERNFLKYALFVSFFPQLVAGPIERSKNLILQINENHSFDFERVKRGLLIMMWGFFQKIVIADRVAILVNEVYNNSSSYHGAEFVFATIFFAIQIYCDFCGYSNIAIGSAEVMGFKLMQNFRRPYFAISIADFWRRWHISLSTWFRDYLYIPLGGNRYGATRKYINIIIVFVVSGLWHGANWTFIIWGFLNGAFQVIGELFKPIRKRVMRMIGISELSESHHLFQVIFTFMLICSTWIFFRASSVSESFYIVRSILFDFDFASLQSNFYKMGLSIQEMCVVAISVIILFVVSIIREKASIMDLFNRQWFVVRWIICYAFIFGMIMFGIYGTLSEASFIYFQF